MTHYANDDLAIVRGTLEWYTNSSPILSIDYGAFATVQAWTSYPDKLSIIISILSARLKSPAPSSHKALVLLQALPPTSLIPLIGHIEPLATGDNAYVKLLASSLLALAKGEKEKAEKEDAKKKWEAWRGLYGDSAVAWYPPPKDPEWGMYGMRWVSGDEWWTVPEQGQD